MRTVFFYGLLTLLCLGSFLYLKKKRPGWKYRHFLLIGAATGALCLLTAATEGLDSPKQEELASLERNPAGQGDREVQLWLKAEELEKRLKKAEPLAQAYESVKDRTAGIELEAHHRAMEVEAAAREQVRATKAQLEQWIHKTMAGYDRLRTDVDATISHAAGELERVKEQLAGVSGELEQRDAELEQMLHNYQETLGPKAPEPLPLEEE